MRVLCLADKKYRIQYNRMCYLKHLLTGFDLDVFAIDEGFELDSYDAVYYAHFSIFSKVKFNGPKIASVTSHKCLANKKATIKYLRRFDAVSVNNAILFEAFHDNLDNLFYTPNGVDASFFTYAEPGLSDPPVIGWVGNADRATKNYKSIVDPLARSINADFQIVASSKKDNSEDMKSIVQMRDYYHSLNYFLVTSTTEGTPNPGLEAMACGIPVISTKVGNMVDIIRDGENGFFCDDNIKSFRNRLGEVLEMPEDRYLKMRRVIRKDIEDEWDWTIKVIEWQKFFDQLKL